MHDIKNIRPKLISLEEAKLEKVRLLVCPFLIRMSVAHRPCVKTAKPIVKIFLPRKAT